jgi:hypothetical protein
MVEENAGCELGSTAGPNLQDAGWTMPPTASGLNGAWLKINSFGVTGFDRFPDAEPASVRQV